MLIKIAYSDTQYSTSMNEVGTDFVVEKSETIIVSKHKRVSSNVSSRELPESQYALESQFDNFSPLDCTTVNPQVTLLLGAIDRFHRENAIKKAMVAVYSQFMGWARDGEFSYCDEFLNVIVPSEYDTRFLLSVLMASNPMKDILTYRQDMFSKIRNELNKRYGYDEAELIMRGLK